MGEAAPPVRVCSGGLAEAARLIGECLHSEAGHDSDGEGGAESESEGSDANDGENDVLARGFDPFLPRGGALLGGGGGGGAPQPLAAPAPLNSHAFGAFPGVSRA